MTDEKIKRKIDKKKMAEKAIIGKMSLYEVLTMIVPGTLIVFCVWLLDPQKWLHFLDKFCYTIDVNFLYDIALVILMFAFVYVAGLLNYLIIDGIWRIFGLRNNVCMLKGSLQDKIDSEIYENVKTLLNGMSTESATQKDLEDVYYEAYTYALKKNTRSNVPFLENQVAMLKGLILPLSLVAYLLCETEWRKWLAAIIIAIVLIVLAICRQKKTIELVLEDYEYEKRIEKKTQTEKQC